MRITSIIKERRPAMTIGIEQGYFNNNLSEQTGKRRWIRKRRWSFYEDNFGKRFEFGNHR